MPAFLPILGSNPTILILGSMPGKASLDAAQYYAHPRNAFWPIMAELYGVNVDDSYTKRVEKLKQNNVSVWDVLHDCERFGSLDQNIVKETEQVNDFFALFTDHPSIESVGFNGQAARKIFNRHCKALYSNFTDIKWVDLPSTSPAHASLTLQQKCSIWGKQLC